MSSMKETHCSKKFIESDCNEDGSMDQSREAADL